MKRTKTTFQQQFNSAGHHNLISKLSGLIPNDDNLSTKNTSWFSKFANRFSYIMNAKSNNTNKTARFLMSELIIALFEGAYRLGAQEIKPETCEKVDSLNKAALNLNVQGLAVKLLTLTSQNQDLKSRFEFYSSDYKKAVDYVLEQINDPKSLFNEIRNQSAKMLCRLHPVTSLGMDELFIYFRYIFSEMEYTINNAMEATLKAKIQPVKVVQQAASKLGNNGEKPKEENRPNNEVVGDKPSEKESSNLAIVSNDLAMKSLMEWEKKLAGAIDALFYNAIIFNNEVKLHRLLVDLYEEFFGDLRTYITKGLVTDPEIFSKFLEITEFHLSKMSLILDYNILSESSDTKSTSSQNPLMGFDTQVYRNVQSFFKEKIDEAVCGNHQAAENLAAFFQKYHNTFQDNSAFASILGRLNPNEIFGTSMSGLPKSSEPQPPNNLQVPNVPGDQSDAAKKNTFMKCAEAMMHYYYKYPNLTATTRENIDIHKGVLMNFRCIYDHTILDYKLFKVTAQYINIFDAKEDVTAVLPFFRQMTSNIFEFFYFAKDKENQTAKFGVARFNEFMELQLSAAIDKLKKSQPVKVQDAPQKQTQNAETQTENVDENVLKRKDEPKQPPVIQDVQTSTNIQAIDNKPPVKSEVQQPSGDELLNQVSKSASTNSPTNQSQGTIITADYHDNFGILLSFWFLGFSSVKKERRNSDLIEGPMVKLQHFFKESNSQNSSVNLIEEFKNVPIFPTVEEKVFQLYRVWF